MAAVQPPELAQAREVVLADMQTATVELRAVLDAEREALDRRDSIALDAATSAKAGLLQRLEALDGEHRQLNELSPSPSSRAWLHIRRQLDECRRINEINGSIVAQQLAFVRRALDVLHGTGEGPPLLYGPGGQAQARPASRPLSSA